MNQSVKHKRLQSILTGVPLSPMSAHEQHILAFLPTFTRHDLSLPLSSLSGGHGLRFLCPNRVINMRQRHRGLWKPNPAHEAIISWCTTCFTIGEFLKSTGVELGHWSMSLQRHLRGSSATSSVCEPLVYLPD